MALEIVGGAAIGTVFAALYDVVKISLGKTVMQFKPLLGNLKFTLDSLKPRIIQQIGEHNLALGLPNDEIESLQQQMEEGVKLVCKLSKLTMWSCQIWCSCCNCRSTSYTDQLVELDRSLRILLEILKLQEARDVKEALLLARKIHDKQDDLDKRLADLLKVQQEAGDRAQQERNAQESSGSNTQKTVQDQNQGNGVNGATLGVVFGVLFDGVIQVKDKNKVFKRILGYLKSTLDSLKPLIEEIAEDNRVLHLSKKELESFKIQMEKGVELVQNCSKVHQWASYKKYDCTNKLLGLDESLQKLLYILRVQLARDVRESLVSINKVEAVIKKIEERNVGQNDQIVSTASCPIPESPTATAGLDALNVEGSREVIKDTLVGSRKIDERVKRFEGSGVVKNQIEIKESCEVVEPVPAEGINDVIEMLDSSTRDVEAGLKKIKETDVVPVQNHTDIAVSAPQSPTVALDVMNMEAIGVVEPIPPVPECKLPSSSHALDIQFGFSGLTGDSKNKRQEMDKEQDMFTGFPMKLSDSAIQPEMREGSSEIVSLEGSLKGQQQQTQDCNQTSGQAKSNLISDSEGVKHENESDAKRLGPVQQTAGEIIIMQGKETADEIISVGKSQSKSFGLGKGLESIGIVGANARDGKLDGKDRLLWYRDFGKHAWGDFSMAVVQANNLLEDQIQLESGPFGSYVGIYDGHGGTEAAQYVCKNLFKHFQAISRAEGVVTAETIEKAFLQTEAGFTSLVSKFWSTKPNLAAVGTSCLVGVICRKTLLVANLGDSRVVLGKKGNTGEVSAVQLSTEHHASSEHIRQELQELHPDDPQIVVLKHGVWRVKGMIQVSRSIGDVYLKHAEFNKEPLYPKFRLRQPLKRSILSAKPTIISHPLLPNDAFLIFASDGLWEFLSNEKAVEIVHKHPRAGIAKRIVRAALQEAAKKREMRYSDIQQIDKGIRSHFHDDITVIVLFLNHELISRGTVQELEAEPKDPVMDYTGCCNPGGFLFSKSS